MVQAKNIVYKAVVNKDANSKLICELTDQLAISIFIHRSLTDDLFGSIRIPGKKNVQTFLVKPIYFDFWFQVFRVSGILLSTLFLREGVNKGQPNKH